MSATGSVNLIVCFSSNHPFAPHEAENPRQLPLRPFAVARWRIFQTTNPPQPTALLPGRLRDPRNVPAQRELTEAQAAQAELAHVSARPAAILAAVVLATGKLGLLCVLNSLCRRCHAILLV